MCGNCMSLFHLVRICWSYVKWVYINLHSCGRDHHNGLTHQLLTLLSSIRLTLLCSIRLSLLCSIRLSLLCSIHLAPLCSIRLTLHCSILLTALFYSSD